MSNLRFLRRDGQNILQQLVPGRFTDDQLHECNAVDKILYYPKPFWEDVPVHEEKKEVKKLREFWIDRASVAKDKYGYFFRAYEEKSFIRDNHDTLFTEVPKGSRVLGRDEVHKALRAVYNDNGTIGDILKELGFDGT